MENEIFQLNFRGEELNIERFDLGGQTFFKMKPSIKEPPITILLATHSNGHKFRTSMPEGRQKLAEEIGILIEQYYRSQKN